MRNRLDYYRRRHKLRKKKRRSSVSTASRNHRSFPEQPEEQRMHPLFSREAFFVKMLLSVALVLVVAILFKQPGEKLADARNFVIDTFEREFQFAVVADWYEQQFGRPLALFPDNIQDTVGEEKITQDDYAVPVSGQTRILETFESTGQGVMVATKPDSAIESVKDGYVFFVGEREEMGNTVMVQHADGSESWYGNLRDIEVALYDYIKSGDPIGKASSDDSGENGIFYFALKKGEAFINPIQVISFD